MSKRWTLGALAVLLLACSGFAAAQAGTVSVTVQVRDAAGQPLAHAVVQLDSPAAANASRAGSPRRIVQRQRRFEPDQSVVTVGTAISFPNQDTVRHHVYSFSPAKRFELQLYTGTPATPVVFDRPGVVVLGCNIHDEMLAWVHVVRTPHFGQTGPDGQIVLNGVPLGVYEIGVWHRRLPEGVVVPRPSLRVLASTPTQVVTLNTLSAP
ncbi:plastocyanin [Serpentinimonas raichei]|uniref:Plastocyanin n=1 Tax=Serpentinimonas raichei TaxID=1458425 RepID=A0A060NKM2_9BURK|nr:methylamine utilization protein [Serpentinimonas raichei]BAO80013.1 plastocyanin [Serpentinimonas raichei]